MQIKTKTVLNILVCKAGAYPILKSFCYDCEYRRTSISIILTVFLKIYKGIHGITTLLPESPSSAGTTKWKLTLP